MYPNPASSVITRAIYPPIAGEYHVEICNILGATMYSQVFHTNVAGSFVSEIPLDNYSRGTYYMYIRSAQGLIAKKFIRN